MTDQPTSLPDVTPAPQRLEVVQTETVRMLHNRSDVEAVFVSYVSYASIWHFPGADDVTRTSAPCYVVRSLPAGASVVVERVDPTEDGHVFFDLVRAEWADGRRDLALRGDPPRKVPQVAGSDQGEASPRVDLPVVKIDSVPGHTSLGLLGRRPDDPVPEPAETPTCVSCRHLLSMIGVGQGLRCAHAAQNPEARLWTIPGRWYTCPVHQPPAEDA